MIIRVRDTRVTNAADASRTFAPQDGVTWKQFTMGDNLGEYSSVRVHQYKKINVRTSHEQERRQPYG